MFSQTALLQFVFANELDDYFWGYVFRSELKKHLFFELHDKFEGIYFVDVKENEPYVFHYGRSDSDDFRPKKGIFKNSVSQQLLKWLFDLIRRKKSAVVFRLDNFCEIFEGEEKCLSDLTKYCQNNKYKGTIILIGSQNSDKNMNYFMNSPVFECMNEASVSSLRNNEIIDNVYSVLKANKQEACVFLNSYNRERIAEFVTMISLENKNRYSGDQNLRMITNYLTLYLNNPVIRMKEHRIFKGSISLLCPSYKELYSQLKRDDVWKDVSGRAVDYYRYAPDELEDHAVDSLTKGFHFTYDDNSIKTKCMKLCVPAAIHDIYEDKAVEDLGKIYEKLSKQGNRPVNESISAVINSLLTKVDNAHNNSDAKTCSRIISAILFCVNHLYESEENVGNILNIIEQLDRCIDLSGVLFELQKQYNPNHINAPEKEQKINYINSLLRKFDDIIEVNKGNLIESDVNEKLKIIVLSANDYDETNTAAISQNAEAQIDDDLFNFDSNS